MSQIKFKLQDFTAIRQAVESATKCVVGEDLEVEFDFECNDFWLTDHVVGKRINFNKEEAKLLVQFLEGCIDEDIEISAGE